MISMLKPKRFSPIGIDLGSRSIKLVQFNADCSQLVDAVRWDLTTSGKVSDEEQADRWVEAIRRARESRRLHGRDAAICLGSQQLFLQNVRVAKSTAENVDRLVQQEAAGRLPFPIAEAELRSIEAADIRQSDAVMREVILLACHRPVLDGLLDVVERAGLRPVVVDVEPLALLRSHIAQYRRDNDKQNRIMFVHVGYTRTAVVIARGEDVLFIKYVDLGGSHLDEAVARHLDMEIAEASSLRRHNGDRRTDQQDPEIARSIRDATRAVVDRWCSELSMCVRYHSVTFRGESLSRVVLSGGEASTPLCEALHKRLNLNCELGDPLRNFKAPQVTGRAGQWDVAAGLALRELN